MALRHYFALHFVPGPRTIFRRIRRLLPGCCLSLDLRKAEAPTTERWLRDSGPSPPPGRYRDAVEVLRETFSEAVRTRLVADVPVGVFLSGGIDSSGIAAAMGRLGNATRSFSIGFEDAELDESESALAVATHIGSEHHHFRFGLDDCLGVLDEAVEALDEPLGDPACLPVRLLSSEGPPARQGRAVR